MLRPFSTTALLIASFLIVAHPANTASTETAIDAPQSIKSAVSQIEAGAYDKAITILKPVIAQDPNNADALNWLGYASRKTDKLDAAAAYYAKALKIDPKHLGALEYQGELFLMLGNLEDAAANLALIETICGKTCEEYLDLAQDIAAQKTN